jgi:hypothetical protein
VTILIVAMRPGSRSSPVMVALLEGAMRRGSRSRAGMVALLEDATKGECTRDKDGSAHKNKH